MKQIVKALCMAAMALMMASAPAEAQNIGGILDKLGVKTSDSSAPKDDSNDDGGIGGVLGQVLGTVSNAAASNDFNLARLKGQWAYSSPAVSFKGNSGTANLGGAAVATQLEQKLAPYIKTAGLEQLTMSFDGNNNFVARIKGRSFKGHIERDTVNNEILFFFDNNKGKGIKTMVTKAGNLVNITFDAGKILEMAQKLAGTLNISALQTAASVLKNFKGAYIGVRFKQTATKPADGDFDAAAADSLDNSKTTLTNILDGLNKKSKSSKKKK